MSTKSTRRLKGSEAYNLKKQLRRKISNLAENLDSNYKRKSSRMITDMLLGSEFYRKAKVIFCFVGMENEVNTQDIIEDALAQGKRVAVPLVISKGIMEAREIQSWEDLEEGSYKIMEPKKDCPLLDPHDIDLGLIPCLSCSHKGARLGYGGGFYDRFMQETYFTRACLCFEKLTHEDIPMSRFDLKMDILVTEIGILNMVD